MTAGDTDGVPVDTGGTVGHGGAAAPDGLPPQGDGGFFERLTGTLRSMVRETGPATTAAQRSTEVDPGKLRKAGAACVDIADELDKLLKAAGRRLDHGTEHHQGWETASALGQCVDAARGRMRDQVKSATYVGGRLKGAARHYEAAEEKAEEALTAIRTRLDGVLGGI